MAVVVCYRAHCMAW